MKWQRFHRPDLQPGCFLQPGRRANKQPDSFAEDSRESREMANLLRQTAYSSPTSNCKPGQYFLCPGGDALRCEHDGRLRWKQWKHAFFGAPSPLLLLDRSWKSDMTYRLERRGALVASLSSTAPLGLAALASGRDVGVIRLFAVGHCEEVELSLEERIDGGCDVAAMSLSVCCCCDEVVVELTIETS